MESKVKSYFIALFTSSNLGSMGAIWDVVYHKVIDSMNANLPKPYSTDEIKTALFQMKPLKALSSDGMSPISKNIGTL